MAEPEAPPESAAPTPGPQASSPETSPGSDPVLPEPEQGPLRVGGDVERPRLLGKSVLSDALTEMMRSGEYAWGACIFTVTVSEKGDVGELEFLKPEDLAPEVRSAIAETVAGWRFSPATKAGKPVAVYHTLVINHCPYHKIRTAAD